jgi:hypothetical protein
MSLIMYVSQRIRLTVVVQHLQHPLRSRQRLRHRGIINSNLPADPH